jgi:alpha-galactosidase
MSLQLDIDHRHLDLVTLYGGWGAENHVAKRPLTPGIYVNDSKTGNSSNRPNPFFMLTDQSADADHGLAYGFNLLYSGNHYEMVEATSYQKLRIQVGINPFLFHYELKPDQRFETPVAVMSVSITGTNGLMQQFHRFVNRHIVRGPWSDRERPVVLNNWEATYFDFSEAKLLALIQKAKRLGIEMFVLDDGWFGRRKDDTQGLGDYDVNLKKLPHGLDYLADKANDAGMKFGLWFEPEMVNQSSRLFESHPDWAIQAPDRQPSLGATNSSWT